jgi:hypothetical protein
MPINDVPYIPGSDAVHASATSTLERVRDGEIGASSHQETAGWVADRCGSWRESQEKCHTPFYRMRRIEQRERPQFQSSRTFDKLVAILGPTSGRCRELGVPSATVRRVFKRNLVNGASDRRPGNPLEDSGGFWGSQWFAA